MKLAEKREQMLNMVDQWQQSDQTQKEFANENQIALAKLQYWIRQSRNEQHGEYLQIWKIITRISLIINLKELTDALQNGNGCQN